MGNNFNKLTSLEFSVYGGRLLRALVSKSYFNFLVNRELLPEFYRAIKSSEEFKNFARLKLRLSPDAVYDLLTELRVLPNDNVIIHLFKQWRDDVDNRDVVRQARLRVWAELRQFLVEDGH